jgi:hypothetical protein
MPCLSMMALCLLSGSASISLPWFDVRNACAVCGSRTGDAAVSRSNDASHMAVCAAHLQVGDPALLLLVIATHQLVGHLCRG